ncbi:LysR family transcriptional regulator [Escherichia coli]
MINELRQGELDFTINTYYQGPYDHEFTFEKLLEKQFAIFCRPGHPAIGARSIKQLLDYSWTMPTPHGSYYKQLSELLDDQAQMPQVGVVCETFSACISLVAKSDFLSILPEEMGCDPLHGQGLVMLPVSEILPKAAYYLIQRRDSRQTPLTASLITQFRRECGYLQS